MPLVVGVVLFGLGLLTGRAMRPAPPPLVIQRSANSPLFDSANVNVPGMGVSGVRDQSPSVEEEVYICGARTKKGTPCSRRVHQPMRCWQHKGAAAMLPKEKLRIRN